MKIDIEYIANLLNVFLEADTAHVTILDFEKSGIETENTQNSGLDEKFLFHIQLIIENGLISNKNLECNGLRTAGITLGMNNSVSLSAVPIRLTQAGHNFANALHNKEVLSKLKSELKDAPFKTLFDGSQKLLEHYFKKKIDALVE